MSYAGRGTAERWFGRCLECGTLHTRWVAPEGHGWLVLHHEDDCGYVTTRPARADDLLPHAPRSSDEWWLAQAVLAGRVTVQCGGRVRRLGDEAFQGLCQAAYACGGKDAVTALVQDAAGSPAGAPHEEQAWLTHDTGGISITYRVGKAVVL